MMVGCRDIQISDSFALWFQCYIAFALHSILNFMIALRPQWSVMSVSQHIPRTKIANPICVLIRAPDDAGPATCWWSRRMRPTSREQSPKAQSSNKRRRLTARFTSITITNWQVSPPHTLSNASRLSGMPTDKMSQCLDGASGRLPTGGPFPHR